MLKKLIKYELKSTSREFFMLYLALIALTIISKIFYSLADFTDFFETRSEIIEDILEKLSTLLLYSYRYLCYGLFLITLVQIVIRFYKNMTGEEGYLTFTLPVPTWMLVLSKLISAAIWQTCSVFIFFLSISILFWNYGVWDFISEPLLEYPHSIRIFYLWGFFLLFLLIIVFLTCITAEFYFCIAVGHIAKKHRIVVAVKTFFLYTFIKWFLIFCFASQYLAYIENKVDRIINRSSQTLRDHKFIIYWNNSATTLITTAIVLTAILTYTTTYIFKNHLNLE